MTEKNIVTTNGKVYYWISKNWKKERETLFFFHGLTADHTMFEAQWIFFQEKYNVIVWDAPCHGKSRPYDEFSYEESSDIVLQIMKEHQVDSIIAIGQSLGGYYIQALIARQPQKVRAFIGIGTTPYGIDYYSKSDIFWLKQVGWMGMCYPLQPMKMASSRQSTYTKTGYDNMIAMLAPYGKREYSRLMQMGYDAFLVDNQDLEIECPVLITHGDRDKIGKVKQYCKMWHEKTGFAYVVIKDAGHNANVDNPDEMNRVMETFINSQVLQHGSIER